MIAGNIHTEQNILTLPKPLQSALRFIQKTDLAAHEAGRFEIELDGIPMILQVMDVTTKPREELRPEIHRIYIDVQYIVSGGELAYWYTDFGNGVVDEDELDGPRDICFYKNDPSVTESTVALNTGDFALYFPWDVHLPTGQRGSAPAALRKVVMKVPVAACLPK